MVLVGIAIAAFLLAAVLGWIFHRAKFWSVVDLLYYPLGCVGVVLFFFLAASEREEILLLESLAQTEAEIQSAQSPSSETQRTSQILRSTRGFLHTVREMAEVYRLYPTGPDKFAPAASVEPYLTTFLVETEPLISDDSPESLSQQSEAAQRLLRQIYDEGALSKTTASEIVDHYAEGLEAGWSDVVTNLVSANTHVLKFEERVDLKAEKIQADWTFEEKEGMVPLLENEKETAKLLLHGLKPYLCVPAGETNAFTNWQSKLGSTKEDKTELQERVLALPTASEQNSSLKKTQLLIWPYVLVIALSLKFAKGVAAWRLASSRREIDEAAAAELTD